MLPDISQTAVLMTGGAFLLGWILATIGSALAARSRRAKQDPRDGRIRSLEAELRVAQTSVEKLKTKLAEQKEALDEANRSITKHDGASGEQQRLIQRLSTDLKDSVRKTRELRTDLTERAAEGVRLEVRVRELETELSLAQSSTNLLDSSLLEYGKDESGDEGTAAKRRAAT